MSWTDSGEPTPSLLEALPALRDRWDALRRSTARSDRPAAEAGIVLAYAAAGLPRPRQIVWCDSPLGVVRARRESGASAGASVKPIVVDAVIRTVSRAVEAATPRAFRSRLWSEARMSAGAAVSRAVIEAVDVSLRAQQRDWPWTQPGGWLGWWRTRRQLRHTRELAFGDTAFGQHDGPQLAIYDCLGQHASLARETAPLRGLLQVAAATGWIVPQQAVCWVSERPETLQLDAQQRLHGADGPALRFADGWSYYAWKGVRVPPWLIEDRHLVNAGLVNREHDPVLRRCMIDVMTPARYIETSDAVCISRDETGELWLKSWHHWDSWAAVVVVNGTAEPDGTFKRYVLQVPPTMRSAREAVAWTYGLTEQEYTKLRLRT